MWKDKIIANLTILAEHHRLSALTPAAREEYSRTPFSDPLKELRFSFWQVDFCAIGPVDRAKRPDSYSLDEKQRGVEKVHHLEKETFGVLILSRKFWPKLVKGLLDGSYLFLACQLFCKLVQPMPFLKR